MTATDIFGAIANPTRRRILELLRSGPLAAGDIASEFALNRPAISEHLQVLRLSGLVVETPRGRLRVYRLNASRLREVEDWLHPFERYWHARLDGITEVLNKEYSMTEPGVIQLTRFIPHPTALVWKALTDPVIHAKWWAAGDVRAVVGHRFNLDMGQFGMQPCEVIDVELERLFAYTFAPGTLGTTITWRLAPEGGGTQLSLEHKGFDLDSPLGKTAYQGMNGGWPNVIERMKSVLASG